MELIKIDLLKLDKFLKTFKASPVEFLVCEIFSQANATTARYHMTRIYGSPTVCKQKLLTMEYLGILKLLHRHEDLGKQLRYVRFTDKMHEIIHGDIDFNKNLDTFVNNYRKLFPPHYKGDPRGCRAKLRKFLTDYKEFTREDILKATKNYIDNFHGNYTYLQQAHYFIAKDQISNLAVWCDKLSLKESHDPASTAERLNG